jgi:hypothetical protein
MALQRSGGALGVTPTNSQKLIYVSDKLGLQGIKGMQGSTVNIFDTVLLATNTGVTNVPFFSTTSNKSQNFTNFQNGTLPAGETLIIERVAYFLATLSGIDLTSDATQITDITPLSEMTTTNGGFTIPGAFKMMQMAVVIANQTVVKSFLCHEVNPAFNPQTNGVSRQVYTISTAALPATTTDYGLSGQNSIIMEAPPVLPPNQKITIPVRIPPVGTMTGTKALICVAGRFGSIFASKTTL